MTYPMVRRSRTGSTVLTSRLSTRMRPLVGTSRRLIMRMIVVFPEPDGPMKTQSSPPPTSRLTSSTARTVRPRDANTLETCSRAIMRLVSLFCGGDGVVLRPDGSQRMAEAADGGVPVTRAGPRASACLAAGLVEGGATGHERAVACEVLDHRRWGPRPQHGLSSGARTAGARDGRRCRCPDRGQN